MTVTLNIEDDLELRAYIKDIIKGQVLSIVREEFLAIVREELEEKIKGLSPLKFDSMMTASFENATSKILKEKYNVTFWNTDFIKPFVDAKLDTVLARTNWDDVVNKVASEKIKALLEK